MSQRRRRVLGSLLALGGGLASAGRFSLGEFTEGSQTAEGYAAERTGVRHVHPSEGLDGIQEAIDEAGPNVTVALDRGRYVGSELVLDDGVQLVGLGRNATFLELEPEAGTDLVVTPEPNQRSVRQVRFENLTLEGNIDSNDTGALLYGAFWNGRFVDCDFKRAPETGLWLAGSEGGSTDDNYLRGCRFIDGGGDALRQGGNRESFPAVGVSRVESCWFGHNAGVAVRIRGNANVVADSKFYGNGEVDVYVDRGTRNRIVNNDVAKETTAAPCVAVRAANGVDAVTNRVSGNVFDGSFREAVYSLAEENAVVGLQVHDNTVNATDADHEAGGGVTAAGGPYRGCSARDNTFVGEFAGEVLDVPAGWDVTDNVVDDGSA